MNLDLLLILLAMDSYNRGFEPSIEGLPLSGALGDSVTILEVALPDGSIESGFSAVAYEIGEGITGVTPGTRVIMYRGTDAFFNFPWDTSGGDALNSYPIALGFYGGPQARLAVEFYNLVAEREPGDGIVGQAPVIVGGHSLGGGLAGFVGRLFNQPMALFDPMPFDDAVNNVFADATNLFAIPDSQYDLIQLVFGGLQSEGFEVWAPSGKDNVRGSYIPRVAGDLDSNWLDFARNALGQTEATDGLAQYSLPQGVDLDWTGLNRVGQRHASTLLVLREFANTISNDKQGWRDIASFLLPAFFDLDVGTSAGGASIAAPGGNAADAMQTAIAYSAVDSGEMPFGNTGIRAFFDDADDFGDAVAQLPSFVNDETKSAISRLIVEFSGLLAINRVEQSEWNEATGGVLSYIDTGISKALDFDFSHSTWKLNDTNPELKGRERKLEVIGRLFRSALGSSSALVSPASLLQDLQKWLVQRSGENNTQSDPFHSIEFASINLEPGIFSGGGVVAQRRFLVGSDGDDAVAINEGEGGAIILGGGGSDTIAGTSADDFLIGGAIDSSGGNDFDTLIGNGGEDFIFGGWGNDVIFGGWGNDVIYHNGIDPAVDDNAVDIIIDGLGKDTIYAGNGDIIRGVNDLGDRIYHLEEVLNGGERESGGKSWLSEDGLYRYEFEKLTNEDGIEVKGLKITDVSGGANDGSEVFVEEFRNKEAGINLLASLGSGADPEDYESPLVFDLDGDGNFVSALGSQRAYFDFAGDGFRELTAWVAPTDGLLSIDLNRNGQIDDGSELFGTNPFDIEELPFEGGMAKLAELDSNDDGIISALDAQFGELLIWQDLNSDGVGDYGEMSTLSDLGIVSIDLDYFAVNETVTDGFLTEKSTFQYSDGSSGSIADAWFRTDPRAALMAETVEISEAVATMPFIGGSGRVADLHSAIQTDPRLAEMVQALSDLQASEFSEFIGLVEQIVLRWTGAEDVAADSRGPYIDARHLAAVENWTGDDFVQRLFGDDSSNPYPQGAAALNAQYQALIAQTATKLLAQVAVGDSVLADLSYELDAFLFLPDTFSVSAFISDAVANSPNDPIAEWRYWKGVVTVAEGLADGAGINRDVLTSQVDSALTSINTRISYDALRRMVIGNDEGDVLVGTSNELVLELGGVDPDWTLPDIGGVDWFLGGAGDDLITTGYGEDTIVFGIGSGHDKVIDVANYNSAGITDAREIVQLVGALSISDIETSFVTEEGQNFFRLSITGTDDKLDFYLSSGSDTRRAVERITLRAADGTTVFVDTATGEIVTLDPSLTLADLVFDEPFANEAQVLTVRTIDGTELAKLPNYYISTTDEVAFNLGSTPVNLSDIDAERLARASTVGSDEITGSVRADNISALGGNDIVEGLRGDDRIDGGAGSDVLKGGRGVDTYVFGIGSGVDTVIDPFGLNIVEFGPGISDVELSYGASSDDLVIRLVGHPDQLVIKNQFGQSDGGIEQFKFADGTIWSRSDVLDLLPDRGLALSQVLQLGTTGRDTIGATGDFTFAIGKDGRDTYVFNRGDGLLWINDHDDYYSRWDAERPDVIQFGEGITPDDLIFRHKPSYGPDSALRTFADITTLEIEIKGTGDRIRISDFSQGGWPSSGGVPLERTVALDTVRFADGTEWNLDQLLGAIQQGNTGEIIHAWTDGAILRGDESDQFFHTGPVGFQNVSIEFGPDSGNDTVYWIGGAISGALLDHRVVLDPSISLNELTVDLAVREPRYGSDEFGLVLGFANSDSTLTVNQVYQNGSFRVELGDGTLLDYAQLSQIAVNQWLADPGRSDLDARTSFFTRGSGPLLLDLQSGFGQKFIDAGRGTDRELLINLPDTVAISDIQFRIDQVDRADQIGGEFLVLMLPSNGDEIWIAGARWNGQSSTITDSTGQSLTLVDALDSLNDGGNNSGIGIAKTFANRADNDIFTVDSDDIVEFGYGDGQDFVIGGGGVLRFKPGVNLSDIIVPSQTADPSRYYFNVAEVALKLVGSDDQLLNAGGFQSYEFADGTTATYSDLVQSSINAAVSDGDDYLSIGGSTNTIDSGLGDDIIFTGGRFEYDLSDGNDTVSASVVHLRDVSSADQFSVSFSYLPDPYFNGNDWEGYIDSSKSWDPIYELTFASTGEKLSIIGNTQILLADGTTLNSGDLIAKYYADGFTNQDDVFVAPPDWRDTYTIDAGGGNDIIDGRLARSTYLFGYGDGQDTIIENQIDDYYGDTLKFKEGVAPSDVTMRVTAKGEMIFELAGSDDRVTLPSITNRMLRPGVEQIEFFDGTVWNMLDLLSALPGATSGDDVLIEVTPFAVTIVDGDPFSPYTSTTRPKLTELQISGLFDGGAGNDYLAGGAGSDFYVFGLGYGQDIINDRSGSGLEWESLAFYYDFDIFPEPEVDVLTFAPGLVLEDLQFLRGGASGNDLVIKIRGTDDQVTIIDQFDPLGTEGEAPVNYDEFLPHTDIDSNGKVDPDELFFRVAQYLAFAPNGIEAIRFSNDVELTRDQIEARIEGIDNSGDNTYNANQLGGTLDGGIGNDTLIGSENDDDFVFAEGYGEDDISDPGGYDIVNFGEGVRQEWVNFSRVGDNGADLLIEVDGLERLTLEISGQFAQAPGVVEEFTFLTGEFLTWLDVQAIILDQERTSGDDEINGFLTADTIRGGAGNDILVGLEGNDELFGEAGRDTAVFRGLESEYTIEYQADRIVVTDLVEGRDGTDVLYGIEELSFLESGQPIVVVADPGAPQPDTLQFAGDEDAVLTLQPSELLASLDGDVGGPFTLVDVGEAAQGQVWIGLGSVVRFRPDADYFGEASFEATFENAEGTRGTGLVSLTIANVQDAPVVGFALQSIEIDEDSVLDWQIPQGAFVDVDGDALSYGATLASGDPFPSWLTVSGDRLLGTPPADFNGEVELSIVANDGIDSITSDVSLLVNPVNDAPVLANQPSDQTAQTGAQEQWVLPSDTFNDVDGDILSYSATLADGSALPAWLTLSGQTFTSNAPSDAEGMYDILVVASDGQEQASTSFQLTMESGNSAPIAADDGLFIGYQAESLMILADDLLLNDSDPDGDVLTITGFTSGTFGTVTQDADGNFVYSSDSTFMGSDTFTYTVSDGALESTATVTVRIDDPFAAWSMGTDGDDQLFGNQSDTSFIFGKAGEDHIKGGTLTDWLAGGDGDDKLQGLQGDDHIWGNGGNDQITGNEGFDTAYFFGLLNSYSISTGNGSLTIVDNDPAIDGDDGTDTISSVELLQFKNGENVSIAAPIILDLTGDGIETLSVDETKARFDLDGDGLADRTSWIGANDAFLFLDRDSNGTVSGVSEFTFIDDVPDAASDLAGLAAFDTNQDGILDANDTRFSEFGVWRDADGDGAVDEGETASLTDAGIASVDLTGQAVNSITELGDVAIINTGSFSYTNGISFGFADAALTYFSAASNMPELGPTHHNFSHKSKRYRMSSSGGGISIARKKSRRSMDGYSGELGPNTILTFKNRTYGMFAPVALDLDGDGIELVSRKRSNARFDLSGNGARDDTGWLSGDDGFLVIDRNNDGMITSAAELSLAAEDGSAQTGLQGLAMLDSDNNGLIDSRDARFGELKVWQDRNGNGVTDPGELVSLANAGVERIDLGSISATQDRMKLGRNAVIATTSFVRSDGSSSSVADISIAYRPSSAPPSSSFDLSASLPFSSPFGLPAFERALDADRWLPDRDAIFDMIRENREDQLRELFDFGGSQGDAEKNGPPDLSVFFDGQDSESAKRAHVMPTQRELIAELPKKPEDLHVFADDPELARRLAMIRQDMSAFAPQWAIDVRRHLQSMPDYLQFYG